MARQGSDADAHHKNVQAKKRDRLSQQIGRMQKAPEPAPMEREIKTNADSVLTSSPGHEHPCKASTGPTMRSSRTPPSTSPTWAMELEPKGRERAKWFLRMRRQSLSHEVMYEVTALEPQKRRNELRRRLQRYVQHAEQAVELDRLPLVRAGDTHCQRARQAVGDRLQVHLLY